MNMTFQMGITVFDSNIWLYILAPICYNPNTFMTESYTRIFRTMLSLNCNIYTNNMIISEIVNTILRYEYNSYNVDPDLEDIRYKSFRETKPFQEIASDIAMYIRKIAQVSKLYDINQVSNDLWFELADTFQEGKHDFNDLIIIKICGKQNLILVTHDRDFKECGLKILSKNPELKKQN